MDTEPLASKFRPSTLEGFVGQAHLVGPNGPIRKFIETETLPSMIFWGPPGTGKTTLAYIISRDLRYDFYKLQAVSSGKKNLMEVLKVAKLNTQYNKKTILFIDEIHRWNKAQQDALLPYVEKGLITLIGATTENPSFTVNSALISRTKVFIFNQLTEQEIFQKLKSVIKDNFQKIQVADKEIELMANLANGDLRSAYNILELSISLTMADTSLNKNTKKPKITKEIIENAVQKSLYYDKDGEEHYNIISAVHKSMRASNPDASVYWVVRMLDAGEDPLYIARRLLRFASEDVGNSDPMAVVLANSVFESCQKIGLPECKVHLVQLAQYLANAPKDNSADSALIQAERDVKEFGNLPVPLHFRNAPTKLMKDIGYGKGYIYDHDVEGKKSGQQCFPDKLKDRKYFKK